MSDSSSATSRPASAETAIVLMTQGWTAASAVVSQSLLAWLLGPAGRGAYAVCFLFASILGVVFTFGVDRAAQYFVMSNLISVSAAVISMSVIIVVGSTMAIGVGYILSNMSFGFFSKADQSSFEFALLLVPATILWTGFRLQSAGLRRFVPLAKIDVVRTMANIVFLLILVGWADLGVRGALGAQLACLAIVIVLIFIDLRANVGLRWVIPLAEDFVRIASYGLRYYGARLGHVVDTGMGTILLAFLATREELGVFAAASAVTLSLLMIPQSVEATLLPRIAADDAGRPALVGQVARVCSAITTAGAFFLMILAEPLVKIILSPAFIQAVPVIRILAIGIVVQSFGIILMSYFRGNNYPKICSCSVWAGLLVNVVAILVLYPRMGILGASVAMVLGYFTRTFVLIVAFRSINQIPARQLLRPGRNDLQLVRTTFRSLLGGITGGKSDGN